MGTTRIYEPNKHFEKEVKFYVLLGFLIFLLLLCLVNMLIVLLMYSVLDIGIDGIPSLSYFGKSQKLKWMVDVDLENIMLRNSMIGSFANESIDLLTNNEMEMSVENIMKSLVTLNGSGSYIKTPNFKFVDPDSKKKILEFNGGRRFPVTVEFEGDTLTTNEVKTPRIVSNINDDLQFKSDGKTFITGNEGVYVDGKEINVSTLGDIHMKVKDKNSKIILDGQEGIQLKRLKFYDTTIGKDNDVPENNEKYRLCLCLDSGTLFRAQMTSDMMTCAIATEDPCA